VSSTSSSTALASKASRSCCRVTTPVCELSASLKTFSQIALVVAVLRVFPQLDETSLTAYFNSTLLMVPLVLASNTFMILTEASSVESGMYSSFKTIDASTLCCSIAFRSC